MITIGLFSSSKSLIKRIKNKVKGKIKSIFNSYQKDRTILKAIINKDGFIECSWKFNDQDKKNLINPKIICLGIRVFDITHTNANKESTCVMKETEVSKNISNLFIEPPVNDGILLIELGYRYAGRKWKKLTNSIIYLAKRELRDILLDDSWFYLSPSSNKMPHSLHERIYQLSNDHKFGGSEKIQLSNIGGSEIPHDN